MYLSFMNGYLPPNWKKVSYSSLKPLSSWYSDLLERVKMMKKWLETGNPSSFWLSGFFFPQGKMQGGRPPDYGCGRFLNWRTANSLEKVQDSNRLSELQVQDPQRRSTRQSRRATEGMRECSNRWMDINSCHRSACLPLFRTACTSSVCTWTAHGGTLRWTHSWTSS